MMEGYDIAQICLNGHVITGMAASSPQFLQSFCDKCGEPTITDCPSCKAHIRGYYHCPGVISLPESVAPGYCHNCGKAYPWTERKITAAIQMAAEFGGLDEKDVVQLTESLRDITKDTASTPLSASRIKRLLGKMASGTASAVRDIVVDISSEAAKKIIWPNG